MSAIVEGAVWESHADLELRRRYADPASCDGRMVVVGVDEALVELGCDVCRFEVAIPRREVDPSLLPRLNEERISRRRDQSGIPTELRSIGWEQVSDHSQELLAAAQQLAVPTTPASAPDVRGPRKRDWQQLVASAEDRAPVRGLLLTGPIGVGKTHLAAATANAMLVHQAVRWIAAVSLVAQLSRDFADPVRTEAVDLIAGTGALVLDDLDKARGTEAGAAPLFDAIDRRVTAGAPLIVTANLSLDEIAQRFPDPFGDAIASRLAQHCETFELTGADRRLVRFAA